MQTDETNTEFAFRSMRPADAPHVAQYHMEGIPTGVLADLGVRVLSKLYTAIIEDPESFVFVAEDDSGVSGFVCGAVHVGRMYKRILRRHAFGFALAAGPALCHPRMIRRIWNTLRYPSKVEGTFPDAELLSIVVDKRAQGKGAAKALLDGLLGEFRRRGIDQIKVMVRADFERANAYYQKHGAVLAGTIASHGHVSNVYIFVTPPE